MTHASLFSGIGGFDLAAEWMGWTNLFNCEWEEFPQKVLKHHFPNAKQYGDIRELDATDYYGRIDVLTGGFPCQPYSLAGKRKGREDERHLWPEMCRVIRECAPRYVVGENVRGLVGWDGGLVFEEVCADLETCGYSVQSFVLPAAGVASCPHRRDRVWFVAHANDEGGGDGQGQVQEKDGEVQQRHDDTQSSNAGGEYASDTFGLGRGKGGDRIDGDVGKRTLHKDKQDDRDEVRSKPSVRSEHGDASDPQRIRLEHGTERGGVERSKGETRKLTATTTEATSIVQPSADPEVSGGEGQRLKGQGQVQFDRRGRKSMETPWENFPTFPPICGGNDGIPDILDGITFSRWRRESIKGYGNAIVPQVAMQIFKAIQKYEDLYS